MSTLLLVCPAANRDFGFRNVKRNKIGVPEAFKRWESTEVHRQDEEGFRFVRMTETRKELVVVKLKDSKDVLLVPNVHVHVFGKFVNDLPYRYTKNCMSKIEPALRK